MTKYLWALLFLISTSFVYSQAFVSGVRNIIENEEEEENVAQEDGDWRKITSIDIYGAGGILGLATASEDAPENATPTGSLGISVSTSVINLSLFYSINGKQDVEINTLGQYGNSLINPNLGGQSLNINLASSINEYFGVLSKLKIADNNYKLDETSLDGSPFQFQLGGYVNPFEFDENDDNKVQLTFEALLSYRSFLGDIKNKELIIDEVQVFDQSYLGVDFSLNTYINKVKLFTVISVNNNKDKIPGFGGTQVAIGMEFAGDFIKLK